MTHIGIRFPTLEIGSDPAVIRDWTLAADGLGFDYVVLSDHVIGVDPARAPEFGALFPHQVGRAPYSLGEVFHEPLITIGYMAALCPGLAFATGVLVAPQRETMLLAKQAAQADLFCGGKLRLGVGVGWNQVEYKALSADFGTRGRRLDGQIELLRTLWTQQCVTEDSEFHHAVGVGISPMPVQRPIPLWVGGWSERALTRVGRLADGWHVGNRLPDDLDKQLPVIARAAEAAGRDPGLIGLEGGVYVKDGLQGLPAEVERWRAAGASHVVVDALSSGRAGARHVGLLSEIAARLDIGRAVPAGT